MKIILMFAYVLGVSLVVQAQSFQLEYSTLLGGSGYDYGHAIGVDKDGYAIIAGQANSGNYPTTRNAYDRTHNGNSDILLTKINADGSDLLYSTYIGGAERDDTRNIYVDASGCVYLTGGTQSENFPTTGNALTGNSESFILKMSADATELAYSSRFIGGDKVCVDSQGNLVILGRTNSVDFATTANAYDRTFHGEYDIFVSKINIESNTVLFTTLIGGAGNEWAPGMVLDSDDNIVLAGRTNSVDFPCTDNFSVSGNSGSYNAFVAKLKADGSSLLFSTLLGGSGDELTWDVALDGDENMYITGVTASADFPFTTTAFDSTYGQNDDAFLAAIKSDGSDLLYTTFIGGEEKDGGRGICVDDDGFVYITGCTKSADFATTDNAFDRTYNGAGSSQWAWGDGFLFILDSNIHEMVYSTFIGGSNDEEAYGIALDNNNDIYLCGVSSSANFPTSDNAFSRTLQGNLNIYVVKFSMSKSSVEMGDNTISPATCELAQNYPNPFNPFTTIRYSVYKSAHVNLSVYNVQGEKIASLFDDYQTNGEHSVLWNGHDENNFKVSSGVYICSLVSNDQVKNKKMILTR